ncbi:MAG: glycosyltransferase family 1 protein [Gammaproteobacteria bacterium]|nr:glycosyltransferase family 1 protein [Gammaproteobacteria bacterium]
MTLLHSKNKILADGRWNGPHGIGRFSSEILSRLQQTDILNEGPRPLSLKNLLWQPLTLNQQKKHYDVYFNPGFNPLLYSPIPFVFTICDLIHLQFPGGNKYLKRLYYETLIKPAAKRAHKILTISEYSKNKIVEWTGIAPADVINVSCGISEHLTPKGTRPDLAYPYLLHVGNTTKPHKNVARLLKAFAQAHIDPSIRLVLTGSQTSELNAIIQAERLQDRVVFSGVLSEAQLADYYRGATALVFPSLYEGFGLPPLEAMACGTPALTSNLTSLPEVTGDAAILIDPYRVDAIADGIERIVNDTALRQTLIEKGLERAKRYTWGNTSKSVQTVLDNI